MEITYRRLLETDLADRARWFADFEVCQYLGNEISKGTSLAKQRKWYKKFLSNENRKFFVIEVDRKPVGNVALLEIDESNRSASIFIVIGDKNYWGKGIAKDALKFITNYGFKKLQVHKIWLHVYEPNQRAIKLYEKFGFEKEKCHKEMAKLDNCHCDEIYMTLLNPKDIRSRM